MWLLSEKVETTENQEAITCIEAVKRSIESYNENFALLSLQRLNSFLSNVAPDTYTSSMDALCSYTPHILGMYLENSLVVETTMESILYLCKNESYFIKLSTKSLCDLVVTIMKTYISHPNLIKNACKCIKFLGESDVNVGYFTLNECCGTIRELLRKYGGANDDIAEWGCKSIFILARRSSVNQQQLGLQTCELLVETILKSEVHNNSHSVKAAVAAAVGALANNNVHNKKYFMDSGACWIILKLLELSVSDGQEYCTACCYCLSNITENDSNLQYQFHNWDALHTVMVALVANTRVNHSCVQCFRALKSLSHDNVLVRSSLLAMNVLPDIIAALNTHIDNAIVMEWGWCFLASLTEYKPSIEPLIEAGVLECISRSFHTMGTNADVSVYLCQAMNKIARDTTISTSIHSLGLASEVVKCVRAHASNSQVAEEGCNAIGTIAGLSAVNRKTLIDEDAFGTVVKVLYTHDKRAPVVEQCVYSLANLSIDLPSSKVQAFAFKSVNKVLSQHKTCNGVVLWALIATTRLCEEDTQMSRLLVAPSSVIAIMDHFANNSEMMTWALRCILGLLPPPENMARFIAANISGCIIKVMTNHNDDDAIVELSLIIVAFLSSNDTINTALGAQGICDLISLSLDHFKTNEIVSVNGCKAIARLAFCSASNADSFLDSGIVNVLCSVMDLHFENESVLVAATYAISGLALISDTAKSVLSLNPVLLDLVLRTLRRSYSAELSTACCAILARLSADDDVCKKYLGEHGACDDVLASLVKSIDDPTLCREACYAIYRLSDSYEPNITLYNETVCINLTEVLVKHAYLPVVCERSLFAINCLAKNRADLVLAFAETGLPSVLVNLLKINLKNESVVEKILQAVCILSALNEQLGQSNACNGVLSALVTHAASPSIAQWACCAICSLCEDATNKATFGALQTCEAVVSLLGKYVDSSVIFRSMMSAPQNHSAVAMWACKAIHSLGRGNKGHQSVLGSAGACDLVAKALISYKSDEMVAMACCMAASTLSEFNLEHKIALGDAGMCAELVDLLRDHVASQELATWATRAMSSLAQENDSNITMLVAAGACETIPVTMQAHQRIEDIVGAGCSIIASLSSNFATAGRLGHNGAVEAIVSALTLHSSSPVVVARASIAMSRMAQSVGNTSWLGPAGACEALLSAIQKHTDDELVSYEAWYAVGSMAVDINNCIRLGAAGACEMVVAALTMHPESDLIVQSASRAVGKLSKYPKNAAIIHSSGDCDVIISSFRAHQSNELAAYQMCMTLSILAFGDKSLQSKLGSLGANELVVAALRLHKASASFVNQGFLAVKSLAYQNEENQLRLRQCDVCPLLMELLEMHQDDIHVNQSACWGISNLCAGNDSNIYVLGSLGACESAIRSLKMFSTDAAVCQYATIALYHLTLVNDDSCNKCSFSGAADVLLAATVNHSEDVIIAEHALLTMLRMCYNSIGRHKLGQAGVCKAIFQNFARFEHEKKIVLLLLNLIVATSLENIENQVRFVENGAYRMIVYWINVYMELDLPIDSSETKTNGKAESKRRRKSASEMATFYLTNVSRTFATETAITDDACLAIASLSEGYEETKRRLVSDSSSSLFGMFKRMGSGLDSSDAILEYAKAHIQSKMSRSESEGVTTSSVDDEAFASLVSPSLVRGGSSAAAGSAALEAFVDSGSDGESTGSSDARIGDSRTSQEANAASTSMTSFVDESINVSPSTEKVDKTFDVSSDLEDAFNSSEKEEQSTVAVSTAESGAVSFDADFESPSSALNEVPFPSEDVRTNYDDKSTNPFGETSGCESVEAFTIAVPSQLTVNAEASAAFAPSVIEPDASLTAMSFTSTHQDANAATVSTSPLVDDLFVSDASCTIAATPSAEEPHVSLDVLDFTAASTAVVESVAFEADFESISIALKEVSFLVTGESVPSVSNDGDTNALNEISGSESIGATGNDIASHAEASAALVPSVSESDASLMATSLASTHQDANDATVSTSPLLDDLFVSDASVTSTEKVDNTFDVSDLHDAFSSNEKEEQSTVAVSTAESGAVSFDADFESSSSALNEVPFPSEDVRTNYDDRSTNPFGETSGCDVEGHSAEDVAKDAAALAVGGVIVPLDDADLVV